MVTLFICTKVTCFDDFRSLLQHGEGGIVIIIIIVVCCQYPRMLSGLSGIALGHLDGKMCRSLRQLLAATAQHGLSSVDAAAASTINIILMCRRIARNRWQRRRPRRRLGQGSLNLKDFSNVMFAVLFNEGTHTSLQSPGFGLSKSIDGFVNDFFFFFLLLLFLHITTISSRSGAFQPKYKILSGIIK